MRKEEKATLLIIDFGSQVTQLIARRVRELQVYCEIIPYQKAEEAFKCINPKAVILSGSPHSTLDINSPRIPQIILDANIPILGICYGEQVLCYQLGGQIRKGDHREFGRSLINICKTNPLFDDVWYENESYPVWMSHGDYVSSLPVDFEVLAKSDGAPFAVIAHKFKPWYGVQFHPEVVHTPDGGALIKNFLYKIANFSPQWTMTAYRQHVIQKIKQDVGNEKVICGLSGGVDSSVTAALIHEAIGENLTCILVDHGLMRKNEAQEVVEMFDKFSSLKVIMIDAKDKFLAALAGVTDPEKKRKIIGKIFIEVFEEEAKKIGDVKFLAQGTLYPDVIESVSNLGGNNLTIKSHHNVGGLPERMNMKLVEPLRELFKDEVRLLGKELGLPEWFIERHPFPGPGLAIRCPGEITEEKLHILREADAVYIDEIKKRGLYNKIWQAFAVLLPVQTVGVMGDGRTYEYVCALRAVTSIDGMTADFYNFDMNILAEISTRIINEVRGINRIVYDITSKPPSTIEWE
ncbi:glutamine-hydrolyzing GMP synthase [Bartonella sp. DGB1]|uniref:glutamine-hydrolyzing GMP synthase n=1 Tax=Bartonella sp. DGB1 TaxID=3239807 RepID=UPI0035251BCB